MNTAIRTGLPAIAVENLSFRYTPDGELVLRDLSLQIQERTITALLGPNGSGKTTLLHLILGLLSPTAGRIEISGEPHDQYGRRALSRLVGLVPQNEAVPFNLSVLEYVLLGRAPHLGLLDRPAKADRGIAFLALEMVGLKALWQRPVPSLSGGERQLAIVARALAQEPQILLLDEPTSHLDIRNVRRIMEVLEALRDQGQTVVFTTHAPNAAAAIADRVVLLRNGRLLANGPMRQVLTPENLTATYDVSVEVIHGHGDSLAFIY